MTTPRKHIPWSHWDRFLFIVLGIVLILAVSLTFWFHTLDQNPSVEVPTPAPPSDNALGYYKAAGDAVVDGDKIASAVYPPPLPPRLPIGMKRPPNRPGYGYAATNPSNHVYSPSQKATLVAENAGAIGILHMGFRYPYQDPPARSFSATFPQYAKMRGLARLLFLQAQVRAAGGDWNGSLEADLDPIQMGEEIPHGGTLIGMLVGDACQSIGRRQAWTVVDHLTAAQARAATGRMERIRTDHVPFSATLQEEEWEGQASLLELMRQQDWPGNFIAVSEPQDFGPDDWQRSGLTLYIRLKGKQAIMSHYTRYMDQIIANSRLPYATHPADPLIPTDPVNQILLPMFSQARIREVASNAQNALLLTLLALHTYKLDHGAYPAALSALTPGYLKAVPDDPFALSGPLRYKRTASGFVLYSVGPDGKDEGGKPIFDATKPAPIIPGPNDQRYYIQPESTGDIVAGVNIN